MSCMNNFQRVLYASRFMRVFGKFKRAQLREKPQRKIGPFSNPVKRLARLKEKEKLFCEIGTPRIIPRAKVGTKEKILEAIKAPKVKKEILYRRLEFLLSNESVYQQLYNKMYNGITPYQCELYMWERQMRDLRKIYRAQYLHKLSEVTSEERNKQIKMMLQIREDKRKRRETIRNRILEDKKRKVILKDRLSLEKKVTQSILFRRQSNIKKKNIYWLAKLQKKSVYANEEDFKKKIDPGEHSDQSDQGDQRDQRDQRDLRNEAHGGEDNNPLFNRNLSTSALYRDLGYETREEKSTNTKIFKVDKVYRKLLEESFEFLGEDEEQFEQDLLSSQDPQDVHQNVSHSERAHILYSSFTNEEKIKLLDDKIAILTKKIEEKSFSKGVENNNIMFYIQLKDKLEASKQAFLERGYLKNVEKQD